jgi:hypothetical protein
MTHPQDDSARSIVLEEAAAIQPNNANETKKDKLIRMLLLMKKELDEHAD